MEKLSHSTQDITQENIDKIAELFPDCLTESFDEYGNLQKSIDFDVLRQTLSGEIVEGAHERYQFTWPGKQEAKLKARQPIHKTLRPQKDKSVDWDTTENVYIEGDNLDALKLMRETYMHKIKMIYIDPPYNTGNDFIYKDSTLLSTAEYQENSVDFGEDGGQLVSNPDSRGRFHSDWCSMIYARLCIARDLLAADGAIFISIDDNEVTNLIKICNEIFGEKNYAGLFPWRKRTAKSDVPFGVSQDYEWVLCYAKTEEFRLSTEATSRKYYTTPDFPDSPWRWHDLTTQRTMDERPNSYFTITNPITGEEYPADPNRTWCVSSETFEKYDEEGRIIYPGQYSFLKIKKPVLRYWKSDDMKKAGDQFGRTAISTKLPDAVGMSKEGSAEFKSLFTDKLFPFPKPTSLITYFINAINDNNAIILDFFAGSSTLAHAVMKSNAEDGGNRKFICVQLQEDIESGTTAYKAGYSDICQIGEERIRRSGNRIIEEVVEYNKQLKLGEEPRLIPDIGFRVFKVDSSNINLHEASPKHTNQQSLLLNSDNLKPGRSAEDLLFEALPKFRIPYSASIEIKFVNSHTLFFVEDTLLIACFDDQVDNCLIEYIAKQEPANAVFKDNSFDDATKTNLKEIFKTLSSDTVLKVF